MEEQQPQHPSRERFNDDPVALMGLPRLEKISEFWKRYDHLADIHDKKMTSNLSENLDVLLIFAALFSAINTAFISLTMPGLSSDPLAETNALLRLLVTRGENSTLLADLSPAFSPSSNSVAVNCLLYASLSCSLLAAVGAMMAKEWLQSFDRTGQTGPLEEQGQFRQRKFNGVQRWHLEAVIQFLPNLLLLSVILFFAGVYLFLLSINKAVAGVAIAFSGGGAVLCGAAIIAGATSPLCPYQSAASRALRRTKFLFSPRSWRRLLRAVVDFVTIRPSKLVGKIFDAVRHNSRNVPASVEPSNIQLISSNVCRAGFLGQVVTAEAAGWLLGTTSNRGDQIAAVQFICTLDNAACAFAFENSEIWRPLVSLCHEAFDIWRSQPSERNQEIAELFGLGLCHVLLQFSKDPVKRKYLTDLPLYHSRSFGGSFLRALELASTRYSCHTPEDKEYILHAAFLLTITISSSPAILQYEWARTSQVFLVGGTHHMADVLLGQWAISFCRIDPVFGHSYSTYTLQDLAGAGENKSLLAGILGNATVRGYAILPLLKANPRAELDAVRNYTACLRRAVELSPQMAHEQPDDLGRGIACLILSYIDPLISMDSGESSLELVRLSIEAVLALHSLLHRCPHTIKISTSQNPEPEQLLNESLIDAIVGIMPVDFERLITPELFRTVAMHRLVPPWERTSLLGERMSLLGELMIERDHPFGDQLWLHAQALVQSLNLTMNVVSKLLIRSCIIRIMLCAWKRTSFTRLGYSDKYKIFISSCRLWAALETTVYIVTDKTESFSFVRGLALASDLDRSRLLTAKDLDMIVEFIEFLRKDRKNHEFIARNADVGINRLFAHLNRRVDWSYEMYDLREQQTLCSRSMNIENGAT